MRDLIKRLKENPGFSLSYDEAVADFILDKGYNPQFGARPLRRTIQNQVEDFLSDEYLKGSIRKDREIHLIVKDGKLELA